MAAERRARVLSPPEREAPIDIAGGRARGRVAWGLVVAAGLAWAIADFGVGSRALSNPGGWILVRRFFAAALDPATDGRFFALVVDASLTTLAYAVLGTALSVVIGAAGAIVASRTFWRWGARRSRFRSRSGWVSARAAVALPRGVHEVVWGLALVNILGLDPLVGVLAIGIPYGGIVAKVFSEIIDETPAGPLRTLRASGAGRATAIVYGVLPQAAPHMLSYAFYRFECSIRAAAILGLIGAGGLGYQLELSFSSLRYDEMWTLVYALVALSGAADMWSSRLRRRLNSKTPAPAAIRTSLAAAAALVVASAWHLGIDVATPLATRARELTVQVASAAWPPRFDDVHRLAGAALDTVAMSVAAAALAVGLGIAAAYLGARGGGPVRTAAAAGVRAGLLLCRAIPPQVWALLMLFVLLPGPLPGAAALGVYNFGILGRLMAEVVEDLPPGPARALRVAGARPSQAFAYAVVPRTLPRFVSLGLYRWEVMMRETVVVGLVGAAGLGRLLDEHLAAFDYAAALGVVLVLIALTLAADFVSAAARRALR